MTITVGIVIDQEIADAWDFLEDLDRRYPPAPNPERDARFDQIMRARHADQQGQGGRCVRPIALQLADSKGARPAGSACPHSVPTAATGDALAGRPTVRAF